MSVKSEARTRLIIAGIVLVFSIVALFAINGGLAWFADSDNVSANNMQVRINVHVTEATTLTLSVDTERGISLENITRFSNVTSYSCAVAAAGVTPNSKNQVK